MQHVVVAQTLKGGRAPAELTSWHSLLDELQALASIRVLLVATVVIVVGVIVGWLAGTRPVPGSPAPDRDRTAVGATAERQID